MNEYQTIEKIIELNHDMLVALIIQITYTVGFITYLIWHIWRQR